MCRTRLARRGVLKLFRLDQRHPLVLESLATREALMLAPSWGCEYIQVEGVLLVVGCITSDRIAFADLTPIVSDCKYLINNFVSCSLFHVKREANRAAHSIARKALTMGGEICPIQTFLHSMVF